MSKHSPRAIIAEQASILETPALSRVTDRSFELPRGLYVATAALYLGFLAVMAIGLATPGLVIPIAICVIFVTMFFSVPSLWVRMAPHNPVRAMNWAALKSRGIATYTGRVSARDVTVQMLILPVLVFSWGVACVTIAALVR